MAAKCLPAIVIAHPDVGEDDAILDDPAQIPDPPPRLDRREHHIVDRRRVADFKIDGMDIAALDRLEPFLTAHHEGAVLARSDKREIGVNERAQASHVLAAQGIAPFALQRFDHLAALVGQTSLFRRLLKAQSGESESLRGAASAAFEQAAEKSARQLISEIKAYRRSSRFEEPVFLLSTRPDGHLRNRIIECWIGFWQIGVCWIGFVRLGS